MISSSLSLALRERLVALRRAGKASPYILQMWEYALSANPVPDENCDAIPYVPFDPAALGLDLTADSLVVDLGTLGGYGLYDFAARRQAARLSVPHLLGVDKDPVSVESGREIAGIWADGAEVSFVAAGAENLPIEDGSADLVIARLLLPYVMIRPAIREIVRILKAGGLVLFQIHSPVYYRRSAWQTRWKPVMCFYYLKALLTGLIFEITGRQAAFHWLSETALRPAGLERLCARQGLTAVWKGGFAPKPMVAFKKE